MQTICYLDLNYDDDQSENKDNLSPNPNLSLNCNIKPVSVSMYCNYGNYRQLFFSKKRQVLTIYPEVVPPQPRGHIFTTQQRCANRHGLVARDRRRKVQTDQGLKGEMNRSVA